jgi:hypothetical protein
MNSLAQQLVSSKIINSWSAQQELFEQIVSPAIDWTI